VDARLAMRTVEERTAAVSERAAALEADAESERQGRRILMETMFELPNNDLEKVIIDEKTVSSKSEPIKLLKTPSKKTSAN
jgi:ATP-dependent protease Clp ATPase subunit